MDIAVPYRLANSFETVLVIVPGQVVIIPFSEPLPVWKPWNAANHYSDKLQVRNEGDCIKMEIVITNTSNEFVI